MASNHYILDTHCLIWFQENNPKLPVGVLNVIQNMDNTIYFSQLSLFEISIKQTLGKLTHFDTSIKEIHDQALSDGFTFLPIENKAIFNYENIPLLKEHRDPFDRLLIASAITLDATILSADDKFELYPDMLKLFWK